MPYNSAVAARESCNNLSKGQICSETVRGSFCLATVRSFIKTRSVKDAVTNVLEELFYYPLAWALELTKCFVKDFM